MEEMSVTNQDYGLWLLLVQTRDAIHKAREKELRQFAILPMQAEVLFIVQALGKVATPTQVSRRLFRETHSVSGIINRMEKAGLVRRVKDLGRKNLVRIVITETGQQALRQATKREAIHSIMSSLSRKERQQLRSCLEKLRGKALTKLGIQWQPLFPMPDEHRKRSGGSLSWQTVPSSPHPALF